MELTSELLIWTNTLIPKPTVHFIHGTEDYCFKKKKKKITLLNSSFVVQGGGTDRPSAKSLTLPKQDPTLTLIFVTKEGRFQKGKKNRQL